MLCQNNINNSDPRRGRMVIEPTAMLLLKHVMKNSVTVSLMTISCWVWNFKLMIIQDKSSWKLIFVPQPVHLAVIMINVFWSIQALRAQDNYAPSWPALNVSTYLVGRCQDHGCIFCRDFLKSPNMKNPPRRKKSFIKLKKALKSSKSFKKLILAFTKFQKSPKTPQKT